MRRLTRKERTLINQKVHKLAQAFYNQACEQISRDIEQQLEQDNGDQSEWVERLLSDIDLLNFEVAGNSSPLPY
jgi:hypothetical protein